MFRFRGERELAVKVVSRRMRRVVIGMA